MVLLTCLIKRVTDIGTLDPMSLQPASLNSKRSSSSKRKMSSSNSGRKSRRKSKSSVHRSKGAKWNLDKTQMTEKIDYFYSPYAKNKNEDSKGYMTFESPKVLKLHSSLVYLYNHSPNRLK